MDYSFFFTYYSILIFSKFSPTRNSEMLESCCRHSSGLKLENLKHLENQATEHEAFILGKRSKKDLR